MIYFDNCIPSHNTFIIRQYAISCITLPLVRPPHGTLVARSRFSTRTQTFDRSEKNDGNLWKMAFRFREIRRNLGYISPYQLFWIYYFHWYQFIELGELTNPTIHKESANFRYIARSFIGCELTYIFHIYWNNQSNSMLLIFLLMINQYYLFFRI